MASEYKQHDLANDSEDVKRIYSALWRTRVVLSSRKMKSSAMAATRRSSPLRGSVLSSSSQFESQSFQSTTANLTLMPRRRPNIGTYFACGKTGHKRACCPAMTKQSDSPTLRWLDEQDLSGVVLRCFDRNDYILRILWPDLLFAMFFR